MGDPHQALHTPDNAGRRRSLGSVVVARGLWYVKPGIAELRTERLGAPETGQVRIATAYSGLSRGTERIVALGEVPASEWSRMRAPMQAGAFPFPVKYGYSAAGVVTAGPDEWLDRRVFALHPHQDHFLANLQQIIPIPDNIPTKRATLAANMETALNAHWDAGTQIGDRVLVVGGGIVGLLVAHLARRITGQRVTVADVAPERAAISHTLGLDFTSPSDAPGDHSIVFHASATSAGLETALASAAFEGKIVDLSWYGAKPVTLHLGGAFHSRRLTVLSSQVGHVAPSKRGAVTHRQRLQMAMDLLDDSSLDGLVTDEIPFDTLPEALPQVWSQSGGGLAPVIRYTNAMQEG